MGALSGAGTGAAAGAGFGPWGAAIGGGLGLLTGLLNNRKKQTSSTTTTALSPDAESLNALLMQMAKQRLSTPPDLAGYKTSGIKDINGAYDAAGSTVNADLTRRGLSASPVAAGPVASLQSGRAGSISSLLASLPLLRRQMENEDMGQASQLFALQPRSSTTTGTSSGNMAGGGVTDMASMLAFMYGSGGFGQQKPVMNNNINNAMTWSMAPHL